MNRTWRIRSYLALFLLTCLLVACSDDGGVDPQDSGPAEASLPPDGGDMGTLWPCSEPGKTCNAHNTCAINPVCGEDHLCRPESWQDCDDQLACTVDTCKGLGLCGHEVSAGHCVATYVNQSGADGGAGADAGVPKSTTVCLQAGDKHPADPCRACDPAKDQNGWSPKNGGLCDDQDACTKDDYCQLGVCKGTSFKSTCADAYSCTEELCDGKGGCLGNPLKSDWCLIDKVCYMDKKVDPAGCNVCDVSKSQTAWTPLTVHCKINGTCYKPGDKDATGCATCDPQTSTTNWTPVADKCLIGGKCYKSGDKDATGCAACDPKSSATSWTPLTNQCLIGGTCFKPGDKDPTSCAACDPSTSTTSWTPLTGKCLIGGVCYKPGDTDPVGCGTCEPTKNATGWTPLSTKCLIKGICYKPGDKSKDGCGVCTPGTNQYAWTSIPNTCAIGGQCYADQQKDTTGCLLCDLSTSSTAWTPVTGAKTQRFDFESGATTGWSISNTDSKVGWTVSNKRAGGGSYALYYGDPAAGNYATGSSANSGTATSPAITLTSGKKAGVSFGLYLDVEPLASQDTLEVFVGSTKVWSKSSSLGLYFWQNVSIDLSTYAGQSVSLSFKFATQDALFNSGEGVYIDNLVVYHDC